jgi:hypothetical protein
VFYLLSAIEGEPRAVFSSFPLCFLGYLLLKPNPSFEQEETETTESDLSYLFYLLSAVEGNRELFFPLFLSVSSVISC